MSKTAYSKIYSREVDVEQLLALYGNHSIEDSIRILNDIPDHIREMVSLDIQCPSCGVEGAILVSGAKSKSTAKALRQAHFRFTSNSNEDAHRPFCEFSSSDKESPKGSELIDFGSPRSNETRIIRDMVCKGIESKVFNQSDIRAMRQWYFELKTASRYRLTASEETLTFLYNLAATNPHDSFTHHPSHASTPGFNWTYAARLKMVQINSELIEASKGASFFNNRSEISKLIARYRDKEVFDMEPLEPYYEKTIQLCTFTARTLGFPAKAWVNYRWGKISSEFLAFCSLLLSVSEWDINKSIQNLALILDSPNPQSSLHGNIIGLNPFTDYKAWRAIKKLSDIENRFDTRLKFNDQLEAIEQILKTEYLQWRKDTGLPEQIPPQSKQPHATHQEIIEDPFI